MIHVRGRRTARRRCLAALAVLLAGCAITPPSPPSTVATLPDAAFELTGRLSARRGNDGAAAGFRWTHRPASDDLVLSTPLGAALARLSGDAREVRLTLADGRTQTAGDWQALTERVLGAPVPVRGLAWWVRASPHPLTAHSAERDTQGRVSVLRQDGWEIVYDYAGDGNRPSRLRLSYPDTEVRLALDAWRDASP